MSVRGLACAVSLLWLFACGGPAAPVVPAVPVAKEAPRPVEPAPPPASTTRPASVVAWLHLENIPAWFDLFGLDENGKLRSGDASATLDELSFLDFTRPFDFAASVHDTDEFEGAVVIPVRDPVKALEIISKSMDVTEHKSRYILTPKKKAETPDDPSVSSGSSGSGKPTPPTPAPAEPKSAKQKLSEKTVVCDFAGGQAVCGTERGFTELGPWLRSHPRPTKGDVAVVVYAEPLRALARRELTKEPDATATDPTADAEAQRKQREAEKKKSADFLDLVRDTDDVDFWATVTSTTLSFGTSTRFSAVESALVKPLFAKQGGGSRNDLLFKLTENASAALFSQGADPLVDALDSLESLSSLTGAEHDKAVAWKDEVKKIFGSPYGLAYGLDLARVSKALAEFKAAKDPDKAKKALAAAVDGYGLFAISTDLRTTERLTREGLRLYALNERASAAASSTTGGASSKADESRDVLRPAPAAYGLPKGSFFLDSVKMVPGKTPKAPKKKETKVTALVFGDATTTFVIGGLSEDKVYADAAKEVLARKGSPRTLDPLLTQKGLLYGGQITSLIGAFSSHEMSLKDTAKMDKEAKDKIVADLEEDLAAPKLPIPFAFSANRTGAGGALAFEIKGDRKAFTMIFEHVFKGLGALGGLFLLPLAMALAAP